ncbi:MAG: NAD(P)-dependent oxidoreductase, partial [Desulfosalsimonadaceae bacterium]
ADVVVHAAADTSGHEGQGRVTTVAGTKNTLDAAMGAGVRQFIYLSSCSVYGIADCQAWQKIDESGPLERYPEARGDYSNAKFEGEKCVMKAMKNGVMSITCLRPGTIWGPGGETFTPMMGFFIGKRIACIIGSRKFVLPLVYLDNMVNAIITCIDHPQACNTVFNVVDPQTIDKQAYVNKVLKPLFPGRYFIRIPYWALYFAVECQEILCRVIGRKPFLTRYRLISSQRPVVYDAGKITRETGWRAPVGFTEAVHEVLAFENSKLFYG